MSQPYLRVIGTDDIPSIRRDPVDRETLHQAGQIVDAVRTDGADALRRYSLKFGDMDAGQSLVIPKDELDDALASIAVDDRLVLERTAARIHRFAVAQRDALSGVEIPIPGGVAGHRIIPVDRAGCYAPGGRFPLPSSVLMTAVTARAAGVQEVWLASPKPTTETLAAAAIAKVDGVLRVGGAQAIAALAYGVDGVPPCDAVVGPGNRWVTAAKQLVSGFVRIDMLAGPSELVVLADASANAETVAADLLAQAEHDVDALPILVTPSRDFAERVDAALGEQLAKLSTAETAREALKAGFTVLVDDLQQGVEICNRLAPEHLEVLTDDAPALAEQLRHFGGLFIGQNAAEVLGDYGAGPNHTLPTGGTARSQAGLSVFNFLKVATWMRIDDLSGAAPLVEDAVSLARMEGLQGHEKSAAARRIDDE